MRTSLGMSSRIAANSALTSSTTATMLASGWRLMLTKTARCPSAVTIVYCGSTPAPTVATSDSKTGALLTVATTMLLSSSGFLAWPLISASSS